MNITILKNNTSEIVEKKSKFIANVFHVETKEEAEEKIKEIKKKYYDSRHNCSAYRILDGESMIEKSSDDGEPSGTAGGPMLNILKKNNLCNVLVVVTRYFGGILLGTGGLVRSYSDVTLKTINESEKLEICQGKEYEVKVDYNNLEVLKYYCRKNNINISQIDYLEKTVCILEIENSFILKFLEDIEKKEINILEYKEIKAKNIYKNI